MNLQPAVGSPLVVSLSADSAAMVPDTLSRLIGQHPAAVRSVCFPEQPQVQDDPTDHPAAGHLELETKYGHVTLIDHRTGQAYANPPAPPGIDLHLNRQQRDLADDLPGAFANRPRFAKIEPLVKDGKLHGWRFEFDTGAAFTLTLDEHLPIVAAST